MAEPQANWRLPSELQQQVRMVAARLGCNPRDVVQDALERHLAAVELAPSPAAIIPEDMGDRLDASDGAQGSRSGEAAPRQPVARPGSASGGSTAALASSAPGRAGKPAKAGHTGSIGETRVRAPQAHSTIKGGCPDCGGDLEPHPEQEGVARCLDCGAVPAP